jgi:exopolysaccharide biosynthesis polyprenyl glycosylphosphotransferase
MDPVAIVDDDAAGATVQELGYTSSRFTKVRPGPVDAALLRELSADVLIICKSIDAEEFRHIAIECARAGTVLSFVPHDRFNSTRSLSYWDADGVIFASVDEQGASSLYRLAKRAFDLSIATFLVLVVAPLLLVIALAIRVTSEGPALFVQDRVGKNGRLFKIFKFRTMYVSAEKQAYSPISTRDRRITKVGAFLRRTSLDELPQLLNVLKGDMSLVGPRPEMPFIVEQYKDIHRERLQVLPGITGLWQISAGRAQLIHENIQYDLYYIRNQSFFMDLAILLHTAVFAMRGI